MVYNSWWCGMGVRGVEHGMSLPLLGKCVGNGKMLKHRMRMDLWVELCFQFVVKLSRGLQNWHDDIASEWERVAEEVFYTLEYLHFPAILLKIYIFLFMNLFVYQHIHITHQHYLHNIMSLRHHRTFTIHPNGNIKFSHFPLEIYRQWLSLVVCVATWHDQK